MTDYSQDYPSLLTADNAIVLHIGVHKTGSTALQASLRKARADLLRQHGVLYPGDTEAHHAAAWAVTGFSIGFGDEAKSVPRRTWPKLVKQARRHRGRVMISSEFFGRMRPPAVTRVIADLGPDRVHVVFGVRRLSDLLPSSWQQYLKTGKTEPYDVWLRDVLRQKQPTISKGFWNRADFAALVRRWGRQIPPERMTAVIIDPLDRDRLYRATEGLLGLPAEWLDPYRVQGRDNRSMTAAEAEVVRRLNEQVVGRMGWSEYSTRIRHGAIKAMVEGRTPGPDEPRLTTPRWALLKALKRQERDHRRLTSSGIRIVGDPDILLTRPKGELVQKPQTIPADAAALAIAAAAGYRPAKPKPQT